MGSLDKYKEFFRDKMGDQLGGLRNSLLNVAYYLLLSYLLSSTLAVSFIGFLGDDAVNPVKMKRSARTHRVSGVKKTLNYRTLRKQVTGRNIFNSEGEFPDESDTEVEEEVSDSVFNPNAPCAKTNLRLELVGTIFMGRTSPRSLATIKEKGYNIADTYRVGEKIIGNPEAAIYAIRPRLVEINNDGAKECLELKESKKVQQISKTTVKKSDPKPVSGSSSRVVLESSYVTQAMGVGYAKIFKDGRLVPHSRDNRLLGYKLIGVKSGSLYTKLGLKTGDVITNVNGISMSNAEQGFALYNALSEEKEIRIEYLVRGKDPSTITVEIR